MQKLFSTSLIALALLAGAAGAAPAAHAQDYGYFDTAVDPTVDIAAQAITDTAAAKTSTDLPKNPDSSEGFSQVMVWIMTLFAWLVGVAAVTLNYAVYYTVVTMGDYVNHLSAVGVTWRILRDIGNILLIFGFLFAGVATIINYDLYGWGKKMIPMMLVAAVFLNFSLFISEAVIDTGNLFATQFYTQINGGTLPTSGTLSNEGISDKIMGSIGLQTIYGEVRNSGKSAEILKAGNSWIIGFMGILLFIVTAFVMFSLAFVLIARFVILLFLIILSPVGFAGLAVPKLESTAKKWWSALAEQTITAPILLLMLYIALAVITDVQFLTGFKASNSGSSWLGSVTNNLAAFAPMLLSFLVAMGLLLAVVIFSKKLSAFGAGHAMSLGGKLSFGATAMGMSGVFGGGALLTRKGLQRFAPNSRTARVASNILRPLENAKFDIRSAGVGKAMGAMGIADASAPVGASTVGRAKQGIEYVKKTVQEGDRKYQQETVVPRLNAAVQTAMQTGDYRQIGTILSSMSDKDFETGSAQRALLDNPVAAALLPQARFEKLQQSEAISDARKAEIATARRNGDDPANAQSRFYMAGPAFPAGHAYAGMTRGEASISTMNTTTRGKLGGNVLTENTAPAGAPPVYVPRNAVLDLLDTADFDSIRRTGELAIGQRQAIGNYILAAATAPGIPAGTPAAARQASLIAASAIPAFRGYYNLP